MNSSRSTEDAVLIGVLVICPFPAVARLDEAVCSPPAVRLANEESSAMACSLAPEGRAAAWQLNCVPLT
jgi:hypothetical protein